MTREIKFRFWDKYNKEMLYRDLYFFEEEGIRTVPDKQYEVMQYTSLKDKNGKEVYEGDVVKGVVDSLTPCWDDIDIYIVRYEGGTWNYSYSLVEVGQNPSRDWEVIGNVYEHEYLVKTGGENNGFNEAKS